MQLLLRDTKNSLEDSSQQETRLIYTQLRWTQGVTVVEEGLQLKSGYKAATKYFLFTVFTSS